MRQLVKCVRANVVPRQNSHSRHSAAERLIGALRCLYKPAEDDGLINPADNPARRVNKPRRLPSTRHAVAGKRLAEMDQAAAASGMTPTWTPCCSASTPRPPAGGAAPGPAPAGPGPDIA